MAGSPILLFYEWISANDHAFQWESINFWPWIEKCEITDQNIKKSRNQEKTKIFDRAWFPSLFVH